MLERISGTNRQNICKHLYVNVWVSHVFAEMKFTLVCRGLSRKDDSLGVLFDCGFPNSWGTWRSVQCRLPSVLCAPASVRGFSEALLWHTMWTIRTLWAPLHLELWASKEHHVCRKQNRSTEAIYLRKIVFDMSWCQLHRSFGSIHISVLWKGVCFQVTYKISIS